LCGVATGRYVEVAREDMTGKRIRTTAECGAVHVGILKMARNFVVRVPIGTVGVVTGPHPYRKAFRDWWCVRVSVQGVDYDMPLTTHQVRSWVIKSPTEVE